MRRLIGVLVMSGTLGLWGCGGGEERPVSPPVPRPTPPPPPPVTDPGTPLGVPECDDYLTRFEACVPKFPEQAQTALRNAIVVQRAAFRKQIATPEGRAASVETCKRLAEQLSQNPNCK